jgi:hypothetical protein
MNYIVKLESFNGSTKSIALHSKGAVANFLTEYPKALPVGVSLKVSCDALSISGTLRGKATL